MRPMHRTIAAAFLGLCLAAPPAPADELLDWIAALSSPEAETRREAIRGLQGLGQAAAAAEGALFAALDRAEDAEIEDLVWALHAVHPDSGAPVDPGRVRALLLARDRMDIKAEWAAGDVLHRLGTGLPELLAILVSDRDPAVGRAAVRFLAGEETAIAAQRAPLVACLSRNDLRIHAALALGRHGAEAVPHLVTGLVDEAPSFRVAVAQGLARIGPAAGHASLALDRALGDPDREVRLAVVEALGGIGPAAAGSVGSLARIVEGDDTHLAERAAAALGKIGPAAAPVARAVIELLADDETEFLAREGLLGMGGPAGPALLGALRDPRAPVRFRSIEVLARIGREALAASAALPGRSEDADPAVHALVEALDQGGSCLRRDASLVLGWFGPLARSSVPALVRAQGDELDLAWKASESALTQIGPAVPSALPELLSLVESDHESIAAWACWAIGRMGRDAREATGPLVGALEDRRPRVRNWAADALGRLGPGAAGATGAIRAALHRETDPGVAESLRWALGGVGG